MALDEVGPSIARGNHDEKGSCADLAQAAKRNIKEIKINSA